MKIFFAFMLIVITVSAQSIHNYESTQYSNSVFYKSINTEKVAPPILNKKSDRILTKTVFGFLPWWEYLAGAHNNLRYDLLSHIAVFSFEADKDGNLTNPPGPKWPWIDMMNRAYDNNTKVMMTITNFDPHDINLLLTDIGKRKNLFANIIKEIVQTGFSGVVIDFENVSEGNNRQFAFKNFIRLLKEELNKYNESLELAAALPASAAGDWNFPAIANECDYLIVMAYDFYGSWSSTTGPSAPLTGPIFSVTTSIENDYKNVSGNKLVLGVPYYGNHWRTKSNAAYASVIPYDTAKSNNNWQKHVYYKDVAPSLLKYEKLVDNISQTPWIRWKENDSVWNQVWYDDSLSISKKYDLAIGKNLKGVGIWALGYDSTRTELWKLIENKFTTIVSVKNVNQLPTIVKLFQNYPNPFNPTTTINYIVEKPGFVSLKVFDLLGREIAVLVNEYRLPGSYSENFSLRNYRAIISSGTYFYKLIVNGIEISKKMVVLK